MRDGQQSDLVRADGVDEVIREFCQLFPAQVAPQRCRRFGMLFDDLDRALDLVQKDSAESGSLEVIEIGGFVDLRFGGLVNQDAEIHFRPARPRANTSSAG